MKDAPGPLRSQGPSELEQAVPSLDGGRAAQIAAFVDRLAVWIGRHWLALFNSVVFLFVGLPFLAPALMHAGSAWDCAACARAGRLLYAVYSPTCHQLPERSFFLFGPQGVYGASDLEAQGYLPTGLDVFQRQVLRFIGAPGIGYKVAVCERDVAIYGSIFVSGLIFGGVRALVSQRNRRLVRLPIWLYALLLAPLAADGATQLLGLRESNWLLRLLTGGLFGSATVWLAYPYVQDAMADIASSRHAVSPSQTGQKTPTEV